MTETTSFSQGEKTKSITLPSPAVIGGSEVSAVTLQQPKSGQLRGVSLAELLTMKTDALLTVLPRVVSPAPSPAEMNDLDPANFLALAGALIGFFGAAAAALDQGGS